MKYINVISNPKRVSHPLGGLRGWGQKVQIQSFQNNFMLHIKLKGIRNTATWLQIFCSQTPKPPHCHPTTWLRVWVKRSKFNFSEHDHLPAYPPIPPTLGMGSIGQNSTFLEHGHVAYALKGNHKLQHNGSKHFARRLPPDAGEGSMGHNLTFSEHGHVAYQIYWNNKM